MNSSIVKETIFANKEQLFSKGIKIKNDRTLEDRNSYKEMKPYIDELRKLQKHAYIKNGKLMVDNVAYTFEEVKNMFEGIPQTGEVATGMKRKPEDDPPMPEWKRKLQRFAFERSSSSSRKTRALGGTSSSSGPGTSVIAPEKTTSTSTMDGIVSGVDGGQSNGEVESQQ